METTFPYRLYFLLGRMEQPHLKSYPIKWNPDGKSFKVHLRKEFSKELMPKIFMMRKFASFTRQLNIYGFKLIREEGPIDRSYSHPSFIRGHEEFLHLIVRTPVKACDPEDHNKENNVQQRKKKRKIVKKPFSPMKFFSETSCLASYLNLSSFEGSTNTEILEERTIEKAAPHPAIPLAATACGIHAPNAIFNQVIYPLSTLTFPTPFSSDLCNYYHPSFHTMPFLPFHSVQVTRNEYHPSNQYTFTDQSFASNAEPTTFRCATSTSSTSLSSLASSSAYASLSKDSITTSFHNQSPIISSNSNTSIFSDEEIYSLQEFFSDRNEDIQAIYNFSH